MEADMVLGKTKKITIAGNVCNSMSSDDIRNRICSYLKQTYSFAVLYDKNFVGPPVPDYIPGCYTSYNGHEHYEFDLSSIPDFSKYYLPDGSRITIGIKKCLKGLPKSLRECHWPDVCKFVSGFYTKPVTLKAYFEKKEHIFTNDYGDANSCFKVDGCNEDCGKFIKVNRRTQMFVVKDVDSSSYARCLVYFEGNRYIYLTNFYFGSGFQSNRDVIIDAFVKYMGIEHDYDNSKLYPSHDLPIYMNGDIVRIHSDKGRHYKPNVKWKCPHCGTKVHHNDFIHIEPSNGNTHRLGCSNYCAGPGYSECHNCSTEIENEDDCYHENGEYYCQECHVDLFFRCHRCDKMVHRDDIHYSEDAQEDYCGDCYNEMHEDCHGCGRSHLTENMTMASNEHYYCERCRDRYLAKCYDCGEYHKNDEVAGVDGDYYCDSCFDVKYCACDNCNDTVEIKDTVSNGRNRYCSSCHDDIISEQDSTGSTNV